MGNSNIINEIRQKPHISEDKNISFGGKEEEDMINQFNAFDILWYAPDSSEKLENWKAFTNVDVFKISKESEFLDIIENGTKLYFIIIATGSFAEKTIPKLKTNILPPNIIIYCMNWEHHIKWSKNYKYIVGVFTQPFQIFKYLLTFQNNCQYDIPLFNYAINCENEFNFNYYDNIENEKYKVNKNICSLKWNKYEKFCVNMLHDFRLASLNIGDYFGYFCQDSSNLIDLFYGNYLNNIYSLDIKFLLPNILKLNNLSQELLNFFIGLNLVSLYFSKFPYLFGVLSYAEIQTILKEKLTLEDLREGFKNLYNFHLNILVKKVLIEKVSILNETIHLKNLHIFLIKYLIWFIKIIFKFEFDEYLNYPIMINNLMDLDFCIKLFFFRVYEHFKCIGYKTRCRGALDEIDKRIIICNCIYICKYYNNKIALKYISYEKLNKLNEIS